MSSPFTSTLSVAARRRQRPVTERSTFVVASIGGTRVAFPVEQVERVVRPAAATDAATPSVMHAGRPVPVYDLATLLGERASPVTAASRVLVVRIGDERGAPLGVRVAQVYDVFAIDTSLVQPVDAHGECPVTHAAVRGRFRQADADVWVIDATRLPKGS